MSTGSHNTWQQRADNDMIPVFGQTKALLVEGDGCYVTDADGIRYLDFLAGIAVNALGHGHPAVVEVLRTQAAQLMHVSNYFSTPQQLELAERLKAITGAGAEGRVFFCNSGTEANEAALKLARLNRSGPRRRILALEGAFHGRTMGALALTARADIRRPFEPMLTDIEHVERTLDALEAAFDETVAAIFIEPIQGEAGVVELPEGFLARARALATQHGSLLILDEVQTGGGRTGEWFGYQHDGVTPDAITLAKGIGGGFPIGALVTFGGASDLFGPGQHGTTFGGNPLATAVASAVLAEIDTGNLRENARLRGDQLRAMIASWGSPLISGTRGQGLLIGIALTSGVAPQIAAEAQAAGLIVNAPNEVTIRLAPPLIVGDAELADFERIFTSVLASVEATLSNTRDSDPVPAPAN